MAAQVSLAFKKLPDGDSTQKERRNSLEKWQL